MRTLGAAPITGGFVCGRCCESGVVPSKVCGIGAFSEAEERASNPALPSDSLNGGLREHRYEQMGMTQREYGYPFLSLPRRIHACLNRVDRGRTMFVLQNGAKRELGIAIGCGAEKTRANKPLMVIWFVVEELRGTLTIF